MKRFLIWGLKWICFSLCGFVLWGNTEYVTVNANSLAYDENSSNETESDESETNNGNSGVNNFGNLKNDYEEDYSESDNSYEKNFSKPNSYTKPRDETQDNESGIGLKDVQGWGKDTEESSDYVGEIIEDPYGVYYTTPRCEDMDIYSGKRCNDTLLFRICKNPNTDNSASIVINPAINDDLDDTVQVKFDSEKERWEGAGNTQLWYDTNLGKYIFSNDKISVCLEDITEESASLYDISHYSNQFDTIPIEGAFVSDTGMDNGLTVYIEEIFNTNYYLIDIATNEESITAIGEKNILGQHADSSCTMEINGNTYYIYGADEDENGIANTIHMFTLDNDVDYYLYRSKDVFDATLNQDIYAGTYTIEELNTVITLWYEEESESFYYMSIDEQTLETSTDTAVCTGFLGYQVMSPDFIIDYTSYIMDGDDILITIPGISPYSYSCTFEAAENSKSVNYYAAYQYVLEDAYENYGESCEYALYDIDNDGIKELIVSEGTCNADWTNDVYCVNENGLALLIGSFARPVVLYEATDGSGIYAVWGNQGLEEVTQITKSGSELKEELILSDSIAYDEWYITYPNEIATAYVNDYSLLEN